MSTIEVPPCYSNYGMPKEKLNCKECNLAEKCEQLRLDIRETMIGKLDSGLRQFLIGHLWSKGDALASAPVNDDVRIIIILEAYIEIYGMTDKGLTGLADPELYEKVVDYHDDLIALLNAKEMYSKCKTAEEFDINVKPILVELDRKYSEKTGDKIEGNPSKLLRIIKSLIYKEIYPKVMAQITTVASMGSKGFPIMTPQGPPRFRNPALDGVKKST